MLVALAVGALVVEHATSDDDGGGSVAPRGPADAADDADPEAEAPEAAAVEQWTAPANDGDEGEVIRTVTAGDDLVVVTQRDVTSIDRATGEQNWQSHLEETETSGSGLQHVFCGAGTTASADMKLALTLGFDDDPTGNYDPICGLVTVLDLTTGEFPGSVQVAYEGGGSPNPGLDAGMPVEIVGDTVVVAWSATIFGLSVTDLSEQWRVVAKDPGQEGALCAVEDMALGDPDQVVVLTACIGDLGEESYFVDELSAAGAPGRTHELTPEEAGLPDIDSLVLVAAAPVVVHFLPGDTDQGSLLTLDEAWNPASAIVDERTNLSAPGGWTLNSVGYLSNRTGAWHEPSRSLVAGDTVVSFTAPNLATNELVAADLRSGSDLWSLSLPSGAKFIQVLAVEGDTVVALAVTADSPMLTVARVDLASGELVDERTAEVTEPGGGSVGSGEVLPWIVGVYVDGQTFGVDFGGTDQRWMAFAIA